MPELWKTVAIGDGSPDLRERLAQMCKIQGSGDKMLDRLPRHPIPAEVKLALRSVKELLQEWDLRILRHVGRVGLGDLLNQLRRDHPILPAEVGPQLRLQYLDQPVGERVYIDMKRFIDSGNCTGIFSVECTRTPNGNVLELWGYDGCDGASVPEDAFFAVQIV